MEAGAHETLAALVRMRSGLMIGPDKAYLLETRLAPLLRREGLANLAALAHQIRTFATGARAANLAQDVVEAMTTNETLFFRDGKPFTHFGQEVLPKLHAARPAGTPLRIWSAAASSGQEAYSAAIVAHENRHALSGRAVRILGTDIAREPLARAKEGVYSQFEVQRGLPVQMLVKHFRKEEAGWRINPELQATVTFKQWNLLGDLSPLGSFDVVFCRNVLIYFDPPTKTRVLDAIADLLAPDGLLYLGGTETTVGLTNRFLPLATERGVYAPVRGSA